MENNRSRKCARLNWVAILSYTGSLAVSLAIWAGVLRVIHYFAR
jgi:hypothetical protein